MFSLHAPWSGNIGGGGGGEEGRGGVNRTIDRTLEVAEGNWNGSVYTEGFNIRT